jgi:hypothetical protein
MSKTDKDWWSNRDGAEQMTGRESAVAFFLHWERNWRMINPAIEKRNPVVSYRNRGDSTLISDLSDMLLFLNLKQRYWRIE